MELLSSCLSGVKNNKCPFNLPCKIFWLQTFHAKVSKEHENIDKTFNQYVSLNICLGLFMVLCCTNKMLDHSWSHGRNIYLFGFHSLIPTLLLNYYLAIIRPCMNYSHYHLLATIALLGKGFSALHSIFPQEYKIIPWLETQCFFLLDSPSIN